MLDEWSDRLYGYIKKLEYAVLEFNGGIFLISDATFHYFEMEKGLVNLSQNAAVDLKRRLQLHTTNVMSVSR